MVSKACFYNSLWSRWDAQNKVIKLRHHLTGRNLHYPYTPPFSTLPGHLEILQPTNQN